MLRAYLKEEEKRCYDHPHRVVTTSCARCKTAYCQECLTERTGGVFSAVVARDERRPPPLFCARCIPELEVLDRQEVLRHRPLWQRLIPTRQAVRRASIYGAVLAVLMVPVAFAVRSMAETTLTPEELARIRVGLLGGYQVIEGSNLLSQVYGATYVRASAPSQPDRGPARLIDTWNTVEVPAWRSASEALPLEMVFALSGTLKVNRVVLLPHPSEPEATWVRDFEILVATESPDAGFTRVGGGTLTLEQGRAALTAGKANAPRFDFPDVTARYLMVRVLSNQGSSEYTSLGELEAYWEKR